MLFGEMRKIVCQYTQWIEQHSFETVNTIKVLKMLEDIDHHLNTLERDVLETIGRRQVCNNAFTEHNAQH